jgi:hypothetical protein
MHIPCAIPPRSLSRGHGRRAVTRAGPLRLCLVLLVGWAVTAGCSPKGGAIRLPNYSPAEAAAQAIAQYDKNGDGVLDAKELEQSPALKSAFKALDKNKDGKVSADELADRLTVIRERQGILNVGALVTQNDSPLSGATVALVPEKFMGPSVKPGTGVTDAGGNVVFQVEGLDVRGVAWGFYRIEVSKKKGDQETIPRRYNSETILGVEIGPDLRQPVAIKLTGS